MPPNRQPCVNHVGLPRLHDDTPSSNRETEHLFVRQELPSQLPGLFGLMKTV